MHDPEIKDPLEVLTAQSEIRKGFTRFENNLVYRNHVNNWWDDKLERYIRSIKKLPEIGIKNMMEFISNKLWVFYILVYQGEGIIREKFGDRPTPKQYFRLFTEQTLPSDLPLKI